MLTGFKQAVANRLKRHAQKGNRDGFERARDYNKFPAAEAEQIWKKFSAVSEVSK
jgi:hypothetical protein